jgi:hypothetical protein
MFSCCRGSLQSRVSTVRAASLVIVLIGRATVSGDRCSRDSRRAIHTTRRWWKDAGSPTGRRKLRTAPAAVQAGCGALRAAPRHEAQALPRVARPGAPPQGAGRAAPAAPSRSPPEGPRLGRGASARPPPPRRVAPRQRERGARGPRARGTWPRRRQAQRSRSLARERSRRARRRARAAWATKLPFQQRERDRERGQSILQATWRDSAGHKPRIPCLGFGLPLHESCPASGYFRPTSPPRPSSRRCSAGLALRGAGSGRR